MAFYVGQPVQILQPFQDRAFRVNTYEKGTVKTIDQRNGNVQINFGGIRLVTFLPHEFQAWLRPAVAQPVYGQQARPAYVPPANAAAYGQPAQAAYGHPANAQPAYVQQPAYVPQAAKPAYVAPPMPSGAAYGQAVNQGYAQPVYQPPSANAYQPPNANAYKPPVANAYQPPVANAYQPPPVANAYQPPSYAPPALSADQIASNAVQDYKEEQESKERELSLPMTGSLNVRVGGCKKLPGVDTFGGCDPYVVLTYGRCVEKTRKKNSKNPEFNESFVIPIEEEAYLLVEIYDYNAVGSDERMFALPLPFHGMIQYGFKQRHEFALSEKGRISLDFTYTPNENSEFKEREDVVVQFRRKPFGLNLIGGPNNIGAKIVGFSKDVASNGGAKLGMYVTQINGITTIGTAYKIVMKLLEKAKKNSTLNFADLRVGIYGDQVSI